MRTVRGRTARIAVSGVLCSAAICTGVAAPASIAAIRPHTASSAYGTRPRQDLTAYWYTGTRARPVILLLHGGYWVQGSRGGWWGRQAQWWAGQGFTVVSMDYRFATRARWPAQRADVLAALAWIRGHAKAINADAQRIVLLGSSAGGQMAVSAGTYGCGGCAIRGVVGLSPVADPYAAWRLGRTSESASRRKLAATAVQLAGCVPRRPATPCARRWTGLAARSSATADDAPMLLYHSANDLVPATESTSLASALRGKGVPATVRVVAGRKHGGGLLAVRGVRADVLAWIRTRV